MTIASFRLIVFHFTSCFFRACRRRGEGDLSSSGLSTHVLTMNANAPPFFEAGNADLPHESQEQDDDESDPLATSGEEATEEQQAQEDVFGASLDTILAETRGVRRRARRRSRKPRSKEIPPHLTGRMGAATMAYVSLDLNQAESILKEIIVEAPRAIAAYRTLALIYDDKGEKVLALENLMKAVELNRSDRELWKRIAFRWEDLGNYEKAVYCLTQALKGTRGGDGEALRARGILYFKLGKYGRATDSFVRLAKLEPADPEIAKLIVKSCKKGRQLVKAIGYVEAMIRACDAYANTGKAADREKYQSVLPSLVEVIVEIRVSLGRYFEATNSLNRLKFLNGNIGRSLTFVQKVMLAICQHRLGSADLAASFFKEFMASPSIYKKHKMLLWEIANATREGGDYLMAVDAYTLLLGLDGRERRADMYLHRAVCQKEIGNVAAARSDLEEVLKLQPRNVEASLRLAEFLPPGEVEAGRAKKRKKSMGTTAFVSYTAREKDLAEKTMKCADGYFASNDYERYLEAIYTPLRFALHLRVAGEHVDEEEDDGEGDGDGPGDESVQGSGLSIFQGETNDSVAGTALENTARGNSSTRTPQPSHAQRRLNKLWSGTTLPQREKNNLRSLGASIMRLLTDELFVNVAERVFVCCLELGFPEKSDPLVRTFDSLAHLRVRPQRGRELRNRLRMLTLVSTLAAGNITVAHLQSRLLMIEQPDNAANALAFCTTERAWALETDEQRVGVFRYLVRLMKKHPNISSLAMVAGNCSSRGAFNIRRYTVATYLKALEAIPHHPLISLCLAVQVTYVAMGRRNTNRNEMVSYGLAFIDDYRRCRIAAAEKGEVGLFEMETDYNMGRFMHQYGIRHMAADLYNRVLRHEYDGMDEGNMAWGNLKRDAAYNLMQIYRASDNNDMAVATCMKYLVY